MGDRIDTAMLDAWPKITKAVETAMAAVGKIDDFFPTEALADATPYRGHVVKWKGVPGRAGVRVAEVAIDGCYEVHGEVTFTSEEVRSFGDPELETVRTTACAARTRELRAITALVCKGATTGEYNADAIHKLRLELDGPLRLISSEDTVTKAVEANGDVDAVVKPKVGILPADAHHLLVPLAAPIVRPLVDGLTPTWTRGTGAAAVTLTISVRFFLDHVGQTYRLS